MKRKYSLYRNEVELYDSMKGEEVQRNKVAELISQLTPHKTLATYKRLGPGTVKLRYDSVDEVVKEVCERIRDNRDEILEMLGEGVRLRVMAVCHKSWRGRQILEFLMVFSSENPSIGGNTFYTILRVRRDREAFFVDSEVVAESTKEE